MTSLGDVYYYGNRNVRAAVLGFVFFLGATYVLWTIGCPQPQSGCSGGDPHAVALLAGAIEFALIVLLAWPRGRWFDAGFLAALITGVVLVGSISAGVWRLPWMMGTQSPDSMWSRIAARSEHRAAKKEWLRLHRLQPPRLVHGARLANEVGACVEAFRARDLNDSYPPGVDELLAASDCGWLGRLVPGADSGRVQFTRTDNGWRWSYEPGFADSSSRVTSYHVRTFEDSALARPALTFTTDQHGAVLETEPGSPVRFAATPVPALLTLQRCLTRVPEYELRTRRYRTGSSAPLALVSAVCPELRGHVSRANDYGDGTGILAIGVDPEAGVSYDTAAVYSTEVVPVDEAHGAFELVAFPSSAANGAIDAGTRRFLIARDGSVHVRVGTWVGDGRPTIDDPIAAECLAGGRYCTAITDTAPSAPPPR
jgi:hypothetical protein